MSLEPFVGEVMVVAFAYPPAGWAFCDGQLLPIQQYRALFGILGTRFGGDGRQTFALPRIAGAGVVGRGRGLGLSEYRVGDAGGARTWKLDVNELPAHDHALQAAPDPADQTSPAADRALARSRPGNAYAARDTPRVTMAAQAIWPTGGGQPHDNTPPSLVLNYVIALQGIFPERQQDGLT
jgi:microcystin-dependent protein